MKKLKPCPFCGGKAVIHYFRRKTVVTDLGEEKPVPCNGWYGVGCQTPDCILYMDVEAERSRLMFVAGSRELAEDRWNKRAREEFFREANEHEW